MLCRIIVTPRMHGIHHSNYRNEANGNWSSLLSAWDYLHGTVLLGVPQDAIAIGVPAYGREEDVTPAISSGFPMRPSGVPAPGSPRRRGFFYWTPARGIV